MPTCTVANFQSFDKEELLEIIMLIVEPATIIFCKINFPEYSLIVCSCCSECCERREGTSDNVTFAERIPIRKYVQMSSISKTSREKPVKVKIKIILYDLAFFQRFFKDSQKAGICCSSMKNLS